MRDREVFREWWLFPAAFVYQELLLSVFAESSGVLLKQACVPEAMAAGFLVAAILAFLPGKGRTAAGVLAVLLSAFCFAVESTIQEVFATYMTPGNLLSGAGNVMEHYAGEALRSVPGGVVRFLLFGAPPALLLLFLTWRGRKPKRNQQQAQNPEQNQAQKENPAQSLDQNQAQKQNPAQNLARALRKIPALPAPVLFALAILLAGASAHAATRSPAAQLYGPHFSFDAGTETYGLISALRLSAGSHYFAGEEEAFSASGRGGASALPGAEAGAGLTASASDASPADASRSGSASDASRSGEPAKKVYSLNVLPLDFSAAQQSGSKNVAALEDFVTSRAATRQNEYTGLFEGKNLILICAEAFCGTFVREDLTPALYRLIHNGFYFSEYIQPEWGGSTTTGEVAFLLGFSSNDGDETMKKTEGHNNYFTMGNQLQRRGYSSIAFHNGSHTYYSRNLTHENLGYNQYVASGNGLSALTGHSYPTDTELFVDTLPLYADHEPFSVYYMTVSGHAPYERGSYYVKKYYDRVNEVVGSEYQEKTKYYICYQMELENALSELLKELDRRGLSERTVIAITGDHYPYGLGRGAAWKNDQNYIKDLVKDTTALYWNQDQSNLVLWCGSLEGEQKDMACEISSPVSSLDILPTLSNLFGLPYDSRLLPGRDVFAPDTEPLVYWNNLSWVTDRGRYDSRKNVYYPRDPADQDEEYPKRIHERVGDLLLYCRTALRNDYFGLLFGPDELKTTGDRLFEEDAARALKESREAEQARQAAEAEKARQAGEAEKAKQAAEAEKAKQAGEAEKTTKAEETEQTGKGE